MKDRRMMKNRVLVVLAVLPLLLLPDATFASAPAVAKIVQLTPKIRYRSLKYDGSQIRILRLTGAPIRPIPAHKVFSTKELPSVLAKRADAIATVGASFSSGALPTGPLMIKGEVWTTGWQHANDFVENATGTSATIGRTVYRIVARPDQGTPIKIKNVNVSETIDSTTVDAFTARGGDLVVPPRDRAYCWARLVPTSGRYWSTTDPTQELQDFVVKAQPEPCTKPPQPQDTDWILVGLPHTEGGEAVKALTAHQAVTVSVDFGLPGAATVIGGFPLLLQDGENVAPRVSGPCFKRSKKHPDGCFYARQPRTALGVSQDGTTVWIVVVDGHNAKWSDGMRLPPLADYLKSLGAWNAINLDGGGSTMMWTRRWGIVDKPCYGQLPNPYATAVFSK